MANFGPDLPLESGFLVSGDWISDGEQIDIRSPYDSRIIGCTYLAGRKHVERAISSAAKSCAHLRKLPAYERKDVLLRVAHSIREDGDTFVRLMALEAGKPATPARAEVDRAVLTFTTAAEEATRIYGE